MTAYARPLFDMSDDDYGVPFQMPGSSNSFFDLDADVGLGYPTRRADNIKVQTILGNAGDLDLAKTDGPTGWGLYTLDDAIRSYQKRNDLKVDGWLRPGGPTISKMRDQFGASLGKYPALSPREVDEHHDRLAQGEPGLLNGTYGELKLAPIPGLPAPDDDMTGANRSMAEYLQRHRSGLADAPNTLAAYIRKMGVPGIVQARDFVNQWDEVKPGQGGDAIRAILSALGDAPDLQRQFFGGPIANDQPIGIRLVDRGGEPRIDDLVHRERFNPITNRKEIYAPSSGTWEPEDSFRKPLGVASLPPMSRDGLLDPDYVKAFGERLAAKREFEEQQRANAVYDDGLLDANNWPPHLRARLLGDAPADDAAQNFSGNDQFRPAGEQAGEPQQEAQARPSQDRSTTPSSGLPNGNPNTYFDLLDQKVGVLAGRLGIDPNFLHSLFSLESGWMGKNEQVRNNPFGYKRTHKDGTQSHIEFESLDDAFRVWENRWGDRVRGAQTMEEFVEKLQNPQPGDQNPYKYNTADGRKYAEQILNQYRTVQRRRENWNNARGSQE